MTPRPRLASDADILAGALRAITRLGPARLTLNDVAREVGLSAAALVQRFGSKRQLLLAVAAQAPDGNEALFQMLRDTSPSHVDALLAMADCMAMMGSTPAEISNTLAFLQIDLTDPAFHRLALRSSGAVHAGIRALVRDAIRARRAHPLQRGSAGPRAAGGHERIAPQLGDPSRGHGAGVDPAGCADGARAVHPSKSQETSRT